ncbi:MAG: heavy-metal-associated domain-containing protein [Nitrososphaerales archaeon]|nr:heavy-metal-associated domain-containing protein [Nitrososphaerales archaeon]
MATTETGNWATGVFNIDNLDRQGRAAAIKKSLRKVDGVRRVSINYVTDNVHVDFDPRRVSPEKIRKMIETTG